AGPLIDQANGAGRWPGTEAHQPYSRIGKLAHTARTPNPALIFTRKMWLRRTGRCSRNRYVPCDPSHADCRKPSATAKTTETRAKYSVKPSPLKGSVFQVGD